MSHDFYLTYETLLLEHVNYSEKDRFFQDNHLDLHDIERLAPETTLSITKSFLLGNSLGRRNHNEQRRAARYSADAIIALNQNTMSSILAMNLISRYSNSFTWSGTVNQNTFSLLSGNPESKYNFSQGASIARRLECGERFTAGALYRIQRFSLQQCLTTYHRIEHTSDASRVGRRDAIYCSWSGRTSSFDEHFGQDWNDFRAFSDFGRSRLPGVWWIRWPQIVDDGNILAGTGHKQRACRSSNYPELFRSDSV